MAPPPRRPRTLVVVERRRLRLRVGRQIFCRAAAAHDGAARTLARPLPRAARLGWTHLHHPRGKIRRRRALRARPRRSGRRRHLGVLRVPLRSLQSRSPRPGPLHSALGSHRRLNRPSRQSAARPRLRARTPRSLPLRLRLRDRHCGHPVRVSQRRLQRDGLGQFLPVGLRFENHASGARRYASDRRTRCPPLARPHRAGARGALPGRAARSAVCRLLALFAHEPSQYRAPPHPADLPRVVYGSNKTIDIFKEVEAATIQPANQTAQQPIISSNFDPGFNGPTAKPATGINAKPGYDSSQASTSGTASGSHTPNVVAQRGGEMSADDAFTAAPVTANGGTHVRNTKDSGFAYPWSAAKATGSSDVMGTIGKAVNFMNKHEGKNYKYDKAKGTIQAEDGSFISKEDVQSLNNIITKYHKTDFESPKASGSAPAQTSTFSAINEPTQDSLFANNSSNAAKIDGATNKELFELPGATGVDVRTHPIEGGFNLP